jgi:hypothetical protein
MPGFRRGLPARQADRRLTAGWCLARLIRKSFIFLPALSCDTNQRGCLPRPAHVSVGFFGFLNLGRTGGYFCRVRRAPFGKTGRLTDVLSETETFPGIKPRLSFARRFSNSRFSAVILSDSIALTSSCSAHNSSIDRDARFDLLDFTLLCSKMLRQVHFSNIAHCSVIVGLPNFQCYNSMDGDHRATNARLHSTDLFTAAAALTYFRQLSKRRVARLASHGFINTNVYFMTLSDFCLRSSASRRVQDRCFRPRFGTTSLPLASIELILIIESAYLVAQAGVAMALCAKTAAMHRIRIYIPHILGALGAKVGRRRAFVRFWLNCRLSRDLV